MNQPTKLLGEWTELFFKHFVCFVCKYVITQWKISFEEKLSIDASESHQDENYVFACPPLKPTV